MLGVEKGVKQKANKRLGDLQRMLGRSPQMTGITRTYRPRDEADTELFPEEQTRVQLTVEGVLAQVALTMVDMWDVVYTRESGNATAVADVKVYSGSGDNVTEVVIAEKVPVTFLLFLDKQMDDLLTILRTCPIQDPAEEWAPSGEAGIYRTPPRTTTRSKKVPFAFIKAPATDKHAAQVEVQHEDRVVGYWDKVTFTGMIPAGQLQSLILRAETLQRAIKSARELANATVIDQKKIGENLFAYLTAS